MKMWFGLSAFGVVALSLGCASHLERDLDPQALVRSSGVEILHEWHNIYVTKVDDANSAREHVGFLDRRFSLEDKEGRLFVLDRLHNERGFLLPSGKAFLFEMRPGEELTTIDLGNRGKDSGVKRILNVTGAIEYELVDEASAHPPAEG